MSVRVHRYADAARLYAGVAQHLSNHLAAAQTSGRPVALCLSDGTADVCAACTSSPSVDPERISLWWSDERFVDMTDPLRVSTKTLAALGTAFRFTPGRVHPMPTNYGNPDADAAAVAYANELGGTVFDLALLAMGADGSIAGLAPGSKVFTEKSQHTVAGLMDDIGGRLTLTMRALSRSKVVWMIASGEALADTLVKTVADDVSLPSGALRGTKETHIFADEAAAKQLPWFSCEL